MMDYKMLTLPNGVRVVFEKLSHVRSATVGVWFGSGSRYESREENGISHFIEHMVFKGTDKYSARELAEKMDSLGGQFNAFTTKECTSFHFRALDTNIEKSVGILCDMLFHSTFDDKLIKLERGVIFEEIDMYEDTPDDLVSESLLSEVFRSTSLGLPILGTKTSLKKIDGKALHSFMKSHYVGGNTVIGVSGSFDDSIIDSICEKFAVLPALPAPMHEKGAYQKAVTLKKKPIEQNHIVLAFPNGGLHDEDKYAVKLWMDILGGGMSSRLFQKVREENGLCYSVYTFSAPHEETGVNAIYTALGRETEEKALRLIKEETKRLLEDGASEDELTRVKEQARGGILMGLESTVTRMNHLARSELMYGKVLSPEEIIEKYDRVTLDELTDAARRSFNFDEMSLSVVGNVRSEEEYREILC